MSKRRFVLLSVCFALLLSLAVPQVGAQSAPPDGYSGTEVNAIMGAGGNAQDYADATMPPASKNSCSVLFKVVRAGSMEPVSSGFQVAVDKNVNVEHLAHYTMGVGTSGKITFSGGGLHEETAQMRDGVLRIDNAPAQFDVELAFGKGGYSSALIYRQCFAPQTTLLLVVKNPDKLSDGTHWLWVKSHKRTASAK